MKALYRHGSNWRKVYDAVQTKSLFQVTWYAKKLKDACINGKKTTESRLLMSLLEEKQKAKPKTVVIKKKVEASVGLWTEKEHRKFVDALIIHGKDWKAL
jgi:hypothetical protein